MNNINPFLLTDGYKIAHHKMYPQGTTKVYSNFTPRSNKYAPKGCDKVVSFGQQMVMKQIVEMFDEHFFKRKQVNYLTNVLSCTLNENEDSSLCEINAKASVCNDVLEEIKKEYSLYLGEDYDVSHIEALWDLGYLPIEVKALPEGTTVPMGVPVLTIVNTKPEFFWLTNFLETLISNLLWKPMTSATIGYQFKKLNDEWIEKTDKGNEVHKMFGCHDFSMRGMDSIDATISSGLGHAVSFMGSDSLPVIHGARKYYGETESIIHSVNATEHSVMCAGTKGDEIGTFRYLMEQFPTGILSIVSDTWDLWKVLTEYLPELKDEILARDGKIVIRPDSGDPIDIICGSLRVSHMMDMSRYKEGTNNSGKCYSRLCFLNKQDVVPSLIRDVNTLEVYRTYYRSDKADGYYSIEKVKEVDVVDKGVVELLWEVFGGTINEQGYKVLNPKIGAIYGDSINLERFQQINERLEAKGFASTNWVAGIGSFTYQFNTRDTFGFAMKATYCEVICNGQTCKDLRNGWNTQQACGICGGTGTQGREIFKDPITDDGTKKSAKGLLCVLKNSDGYYLQDQVTWNEEGFSELKTIFEDGNFYNQTTLTEIRNKLNK